MTATALTKAAEALLKATSVAKISEATSKEAAFIIEQIGIALAAIEAESLPATDAGLDIAGLRKLLVEATPGPWEVDSVDTEDGRGKYSTSEIASTALNVPRSMDVVVEFSNATVAEIHEDYGDEDGFVSRWDEASRRNATLIAAAVNSLSALLDIAERQPATDAECEEMAVRLEKSCETARRSLAETWRGEALDEFQATFAGAAALLRRPRQTADRPEDYGAKLIAGRPLPQPRQTADAAEMRERCARLIEEYQETHLSNKDGDYRSVSSRREGNLAGLAFAAAIRALPLSPAPQEADND